MTTRRKVLGMAGALPLVACAGGRAATAEGPKAQLKLASFNIWHNLGDWPRRQPLLIEALRAEDADVICLQEVLQDANVGLENQAQMLARELGGYQLAFVSTDAQGSARRYGNAILTRLPVLDQAMTRLEPLDDYRTALRMRLAVAGRPVDVVTTHLAWQEDAGAVRVQQVAGLMDWLPKDGVPLVIAGDFNAPLEGSGLMALTGPRFETVLKAGAVATTLNPEKGHPLRVIDHIFFEAQAFKLDEAHLFGNRQTEGEYPSDHFGVAARLRLS